MIRLLEKIFINKRPEKEKRQAYGILCGVVGILLNVCLFAGKFTAGVISNSIGICVWPGRGGCDPDYGI